MALGRLLCCLLMVFVVNEWEKDHPNVASEYSVIWINGTKKMVDVKYCRSCSTAGFSVPLNNILPESVKTNTVVPIMSDYASFDRFRRALDGNENEQKEKDLCFLYQINACSEDDHGLISNSTEEYNLFLQLWYALRLSNLTTTGKTMTFSNLLEEDIFDDDIIFDVSFGQVYLPNLILEHNTKEHKEHIVRKERLVCYYISALEIFHSAMTVPVKLKNMCPALDNCKKLGLMISHEKKGNASYDLLRTVQECIKNEHAQILVLFFMLILLLSKKKSVTLVQSLAERLELEIYYLQSDDLEKSNTENESVSQRNIDRETLFSNESEYKFNGCSSKNTEETPDRVQKSVRVDALSAYNDCGLRSNTEGDNTGELLNGHQEPVAEYKTHIESESCSIDTWRGKSASTADIVLKNAHVEASLSDADFDKQTPDGDNNGELLNGYQEPVAEYKTHIESESCSSDTRRGKSASTADIVLKNAHVEASLSDADFDLQRKREGATGHEDEVLCKICFLKYISIVFLPCSHMVACECCSNVLRRCAVCRSVIKGTLKADFQ